MVIQIEELKSFLAEASASNGKGPSSVTHHRMDRNTQINAKNDFAVVCDKKKASKEAREDNKNS